MLDNLNIRNEYEETINELKRYYSTDDIRMRRAKIYSCNHKYLKIRPYSFEYSYVPPVVECLKCGLTNKYMEVEDLLTNEEIHEVNIHDIDFNELKNRFGKIETLESTLFKEYYSNWFKLRDNDLNLISNDSIDTSYGRLLYKIASNLSDTKDESEIFNIMKIIYDNPHILNDEKEVVKTKILSYKNV